MAEGAILEQPEEVVETDEQPVEEEVPSVFSVTNRYLVGRVEVTPPAEDGSRLLRLHSASGAAVIEANLAPQLCEFVSEKLIEVEVITEDEASEDADRS